MCLFVLIAHPWEQYNLSTILKLEEDPGSVAVVTEPACSLSNILTQGFPS